MKILLIDADSTIPNIALCKLSYYYKQKGNTVDFLKLNIPYYPNRKKVYHEIDTSGYDKVFCSVVFKESINYVVGDGIIFGGTGYDYKTKLDSNIENSELDYTLYPDSDISYGFISRGCIRKCEFCSVREKEGYLKQVSYIDRIVRHKKVKFLDNNFLALSNHKVLLNELIDKKIKCQFNQGLDIRLVDDENSTLLSRLNYLGDYIFAFDNVDELDKVADGLLKLNWRKPFQFKFFVYANPDKELQDLLFRIMWLRDNKCLAYVMRDTRCWNSKHKDFYTDLAAWCNQVSLFKNMEFEEFIMKRHKGNSRSIHSLEKYKGTLGYLRKPRLRIPKKKKKVATKDG